MSTTTSTSTTRTDVSIDIRHEAGGYVSAHVYRLDGELMVITPPCDTQEGAISVAKAMWQGGKLALPASFEVYGTA